MNTGQSGAVCRWHHQALYRSYCILFRAVFALRLYQKLSILFCLLRKEFVSRECQADGRDVIGRIEFKAGLHLLCTLTKDLDVFVPSEGPLPAPMSHLFLLPRLWTIWRLSMQLAGCDLVRPCSLWNERTRPHKKGRE